MELVLRCSLVICIKKLKINLAYIYANILVNSLGNVINILHFNKRYIYHITLEVNSQTKYEFYIFIETLQIVSSMCSLQMSM